MRLLKGLAILLTGAVMLQPVLAAAQGREGHDTVETIDLAETYANVDPAAISVPSLSFTADRQFEKDFDKYYYFHRDATTFTMALADIRDCDNLSRGLASPYGNIEAPFPNIGNGVLGAIFGSAQVRALRRISMRRCMFYKSYQRYGLSKDLWQKFNFEEGYSPIKEKARQGFLMQQAKVASGPKPTTQALGK